MRDAWFPVALMGIGLLTVWLGIIGPIPAGYTSWIQAWQPLIAATVASTVASAAAAIAFRNTTRSIEHADRLKQNERRRKHAAIRAVLPLALAKITAYAQTSASSLDGVLEKLRNNTAITDEYLKALAQDLPDEALETLSLFIEYSDDLEVGVLESTVAWIQIHDSRVRGTVNDHLLRASDSLAIRQTTIDGYMIDAAAIYAGAAAFYDYARRRENLAPRQLTWTAVESAMQNMRLWDGTHPRLWAIVAERQKLTSGPFAKLG